MRAILRRISHFAVSMAILSFQGPLPLASQNALAAESASNAQSLSISELENGIADRLKRVEEFKFIEQEAKKLGVRAWLFGGTAAGYAHYVKWDLQREKGDIRFQADRFDYDYTNVYRSTQDLDIVMDGDTQQAQALQSALADKYPHLQGSKTAWEVRLLTQDLGDKQALLNNPEFLNQHTDSNSTGLIEITKPQTGESVVRDVRDWHAKEPYFLKDVHDGALHYYFSPNHEATKFAKEGRNPPILSAIRYLTKAFQYELALRPEDLVQIAKVIDKFEPKRDVANPYVSHWIEKNGKKLFQNAVNIEYAWNTLEQLGLRKKLIAIKDNASEVDTLAWWMNKAPLRTEALGSGNGKSAKELGLDIVAHETNHFLAYESITRAHTGDPNVFISRDGAAGEGAVYGDGFYTQVGREGARRTGLTIRFHLDPSAREGGDFIRVPTEDYVVVKNKAALKVIPESLNIGPVEYFEMLDRGEMGLGKGDRGILEKLERRMGAKMKALTEEQENQITKIVKAHIDEKSIPKYALLEKWFSLPVSRRHLELVEALLKKGTVDGEIARYALSMPNANEHPEWVEILLKRGTANKEIAQYVLSRPRWKNHPEWVETLMYRGSADREILWYVLSQPHWKDHPEWVEYYIRRPPKGAAWDTEMTALLSHPHWKNHPELVKLGGQNPTPDTVWSGIERRRREEPGIAKCILQAVMRLLKPN